MPLLYREAPHLWGGLVSARAAPVLAGGVAAELLSGWALLRRHFRLARASAVVPVSLLLLGWGLALHPYLICPDVTLTAAAAPAPTLRFILAAVPAALAVLLPSLWLLFRAFQGRGPEGAPGSQGAEPAPLAEGPRAGRPVRSWPRQSSFRQGRLFHPVG